MKTIYIHHTPLEEEPWKKNQSIELSFNIDTDYFDSNDPDKLYDLMSKVTNK